MSIDIESLGFTKEELQQRVIEACVQRIFETTDMDEDGEFTVESPMAARLEKVVKDAIERKVSLIAEKHILPLAESYIENLTIQQTNGWGEKIGTKLTFIEYLIKRAESYLIEEVNFDGKTKTEVGCFSWTKAQTRLSHMIHQHLHYSIDSAMKQAMATANSAIAGGIQETVKIKLNEIAAAMQVNLKSR